MIDSPADFHRFWMSGNPMLRHRLTHDEASVETWRAVIASLPEARATVARNKTLPPELLIVLAGDEDPRVREEVAGRRGLPRSAQETLISDAEMLVRHRLAFNATLAADLRARLEEDEDETVRHAAQQRGEQGSKD